MKVFILFFDNFFWPSSIFIFFKSSSIFLNFFMSSSIFLGLLSSWVKISLHSKNQLPTLSGRALKVVVVEWVECVGGVGGWSN